MKTKLLPEIHLHREPDGATFLCVSRRDVPLVSARAVCSGGKAVEPESEVGLSLLAADLLNEGPVGTSPEQWHRILDRDAVGLHAHAEDDRWVAACGCLSEDTDLAGGLFADWLSRPGLPRGEWRQIVERRRVEMRESWAQPAAVVGYLALAQALGSGHPGGRFPDERSVAGAGYAAASGLARSAFRGGSEVYGLIGGDVSVEDGFRLLREAVSAFEPTEDSLPREPAPSPSEARTWLMDAPRTDQAFFALTREGVRAGDPDRVALRVANYALGGGGFSSRLMAAARSRLGHTYGIHSSLREARMANPFMISSFTRAGNLGDMLGVVDDVLKQVAEEGFDEDEVAAARDHIHGRMPIRLSSPLAALAHAHEGLRAGLALEDLESDWRAAREVSREAVNAAARRIVGDGGFRLAVVGPAKTVLPQVRERGKVAAFRFGRAPSGRGRPA